VRALSRIELLTAQSPAGMTEHQVSVSNDRASWTSAYSVRVIRKIISGCQSRSTCQTLHLDHYCLRALLGRMEGDSGIPAIRNIADLRILGRRLHQSEGPNKLRLPVRRNSHRPAYDYSCLYSDCPRFPATYSSSNPASMNLSSFSERQYWVLLDNNEPSNETVATPDRLTRRCRTVHPRGHFRVCAIIDTAIGEDFHRAHLVLNSNIANPCLAASLTCHLVPTATRAMRIWGETVKC